MFMYHHLFTYFTTDGPWDSFQIGRITNRSTVNTPVHIFWRTYACVSLGFILRGGIAKSYGLRVLHSGVNNILLNSFTE